MINKLFPRLKRVAVYKFIKVSWRDMGILKSYQKTKVPKLIRHTRQRKSECHVLIWTSWRRHDIVTTVTKPTHWLTTGGVCPGTNRERILDWLRDFSLVQSSLLIWCSWLLSICLSIHLSGPGSIHLSTWIWSCCLLLQPLCSHNLWGSTLTCDPACPYSITSSRLLTYSY